MKMAGGCQPALGFGGTFTSLASACLPREQEAVSEGAVDGAGTSGFPRGGPQGRPPVPEYEHRLPAAGLHGCSIRLEQHCW